jgi:hypothetical protein
MTSIDRNGISSSTCFRIRAALAAHAAKPNWAKANAGNPTHSALRRELEINHSMPPIKDPIITGPPTSHKYRLSVA